MNRSSTASRPIGVFRTMLAILAGVLLTVAMVAPATQAQEAEVEVTLDKYWTGGGQFGAGATAELTISSEGVGSETGSSEAVGDTTPAVLTVGADAVVTLSETVAQGPNEEFGFMDLMCVKGGAEGGAERGVDASVDAEVNYTATGTINLADYDSSEVSCRFTNTPQIDPVEENDLVVAQSGDTEVTLSSDGTPVAAQWDATIENVGPDAENVDVYMEVDPAFTFDNVTSPLGNCIQDSPVVYDCFLDTTLASGDSTVVTISASTASGATPGSYNVHTDAFADGKEATPQNNISDLTVEILAADEPDPDPDPTDEPDPDPSDEPAPDPDPDDTSGDDSADDNGDSGDSDDAGAAFDEATAGDDNDGEGAIGIQSGVEPEAPIAPLALGIGLLSAAGLLALRRRRQQQEG